MASIVVKVWLEELGIDKSIHDVITLSITSEGQTVASELPLSDPLSIELTHFSSNLRASFTINETEIASGYLALPEDAQFTGTHSYKDHLVSNLKNVHVNNTKFTAGFSIEIQNYSPVEKAEQGDQDHPIFLQNTTSFGNTWQTSTLGRTKGDTSPLNNRVNPSHPTKQEKVFRYKEEELHGYLTRIVDRHI